MNKCRHNVSFEPEDVKICPHCGLAVVSIADRHTIDPKQDGGYYAGEVSNDRKEAEIEIESSHQPDRKETEEKQWRRDLISFLDYSSGAIKFQNSCFGTDGWSHWMKSLQELKNKYL